MCIKQCIKQVKSGRKDRHIEILKMLELTDCSELQNGTPDY